MALIQNRLLVLNLYLPIGLALYNSIGRAIPAATIDSLKTFIIYLLCSLPVFFVASLSSQLILERLKGTRIPNQASLIIGAAIAVIFAYFYLWVFSICVWNWAPWLKSGFSYEFTPGMGGFWAYLGSSTSLLFFPLWFFASMVYEYASRDVLFFTNKRGEPKPSLQDTLPGAATQTPQQAGFVSKIPSRLGHAILALEAQQHYVRVYTEAGSDLILYRFGDAVSELEAQGLGVQVHRSFFINPDYVAETKRGGRSMLLRMRNGLDVPVSQSYRSVVARFSRHHEENSAPLGPAPSAN